MLTLAIDTSSRTGSAAILNDKSVLVEFLFKTEANHAEVLLEVIEILLNHCDVKMKDIDLMALTTGPGSFTGLRIGASTVKGLALPGNKTVVGISTLEALACNAVTADIDICPMLDAKRKEVYAGLYGVGKDGLPAAKMNETVAEPGDFIRRLTDEVFFLGDGFQKYADFIKKECPVKARFAPEHLQFVRASAVGLLGIQKLHKGQTLDLMRFIPQYLRLSQAEVRLMG